MTRPGVHFRSIPERPHTEPASFRARLAELADRPSFEFPAAAVPARFRRAAVLIAFWEQEGEVHTLLTRRSLSMARHAGHVSFPGGLLERGETWGQAALREAREEVGLVADPSRVLGRLDDAWTTAGSHLVPVVAWLESRPTLCANPHEVEGILTPSIAELLRPEAASEREVDVRGKTYVNPILTWSGGRASGLTADLLIEVLAWGTGGAPAAGPRRLSALEAFTLA